MRGDSPSPGLLSLSSGGASRRPVGNPTSPRKAGRGKLGTQAGEGEEDVFSFPPSGACSWLVYHPALGGIGASGARRRGGVFFAGGGERFRPSVAFFPPPPPPSTSLYPPL